jgi:hypothetical protein
MTVFEDEIDSRYFSSRFSPPSLPVRGLATPYRDQAFQTRQDPVEIPAIAFRVSTMILDHWPSSS